MPWMVIGAGSEEVTLQAGWAQPCQPPCAVLSYFGRGVTPPPRELLWMGRSPCTPGGDLVSRTSCSRSHSDAMNNSERI